MKLRNSIVISGFFMSLLLGGVYTSQAVLAADTQHITMSPTTTEIKVDPGGTYEGQATVVNQGVDNFAAKFSVSAYQTKDLTYDPVFKPIAGAPDVSKWITIKSATNIASVKSQQVVYVDYTLTVPANTPPGGYYGVLLASAEPEATGEQGVIRRNQVGNILYITVNGDVKQSGTVDMQSVPAFSFGSAVDFPAVISNTGGVHFRSNYNVRVTSLFGGAEAFSTKQNSVYVLPQTKRLVQPQWDSPPIGIYKVSRSATLPSGATKPVDSWLVVVNPLLLIGVGCLVVAMILWLTYRRKSRARGK